MNETAPTPPSRELLPRHIGIIMDGNGRWAAKRGLPRNMGHQEGAKTFGKIIRYARTLGIGAVTAYAFSTENWKRPKDEVDALMSLLRRYLGELEQHKDENARLCILGDRSPLSEELRRAIERAEEGSRNNTGITVNIALNYGGRDEIVHGARKLAEACVRGELRPEEIDEGHFSDALYTAGQPDPDVIIRPSGEMRLSNFMLWQSAYAELVFMHVLWPDFTPEHLNWALWEYTGRNRRFGGV
ncbi:isoprenyl transferase [Angelakisella massiliensis]|uniref:isoprenyl transferase n=1 Tax=Angelakisella massiliensis TaxID=1871018 RepID=UPI0023A7C443|nr:isoprenyl transferase [Angelakisella massiliensis]